MTQISYELAKELKDAGFPVPQWDGGDYRWRFRAGDPGDWYFCPTLSELIEACGERLAGIIRTVGGWTAYEGLYEIEREGPTPEEAVARLWLPLSKK